MKKIMLSLGFVALCGSAFAEEATTSTESVDCSCDHHDGIYLGLGALWDFVNDNLTLHDFKGCTDAGGAAAVDAVWTPVKSTAIKKKSLGNKFAGTFTIGVGKALSNKVYLGGEIFCNFGQSKSIDAKDVISGEIIAAAAAPAVAAMHTVARGTLKTNGVSFGLAARIGYALANGFMPYIKAGALYSKGSFDLITAQGADAAAATAAMNAIAADARRLSKTINKWQPQIGIGLQKTFCKKVITRLEAMYTFKNDVKHEYCVGADGEAPVLGNLNDLKGTVKHRKGGNFSVGVSVAYNVKF